MTPADFAAKLQRIATEVVGEVISLSTKETALRMERNAKKRVSNQTLRVRTGHLRRSIRGFVRSEAGAIEMVVAAGGVTPQGDSVPYAAVFEAKAPTVIRPKKGRYLRIPLPDALTKAGVDRYPGPLRETGAGIFRFQQTQKGQPILIHIKTGKPWYLLRTSVTIAPRPFLAPAVEEEAAQFPDRAGKRLTAAILRELKR